MCMQHILHYVSLKMILIILENLYSYGITYVSYVICDNTNGALFWKKVMNKQDRRKKIQKQAS